ncbi:MAG: CCA tRNA nucleotidyltransferase [Patescibacteria group bacterium]
MNLKSSIPSEILNISETLTKAGFESYLVGGCVRDLLLGRKPKDWDLTTNARPEQIVQIFEAKSTVSGSPDSAKAESRETFYENDFGTVTVKNAKPGFAGSHDAPEGAFSEDFSLRNVEITPYRLEGKYSDKRRPDTVEFSDKLDDDLQRRDFTINAIAYDAIKDNLVDPYKGQNDLKDKLVRAVGNPVERFEEDALRLMRAVRIATELNFAIEADTMTAISQSAALLGHIAKERVQVEFSKIIMSDSPLTGIVLLQKLGLLSHIAPELEQGIGCEQNGDHIYHVWEHNLRAVQHSSERNWPLRVRLAALLHDVGKPKTRVWSDENKDWTFYGHDVVGARMSRKILERLKYSGEITEKVEKLVRWHLFFTDIDKITLSAVRRIVSKVGPDLVWDLMNVRACDRIGMGRPKEVPYRLRKYESMIEEAMRAPVSVQMLKINGTKLLEIGQETNLDSRSKGGPWMGWVLHALLEEVLDDPEKNTSEYLDKTAKSLASRPDEELKALGEKGKETKESAEEAELSEIRKKYGVK